MKPSVIFKRSIDIVMYVLFLLLMGQCVLRGAAHEWLGIAVGVLFVLHNVLNYRWYKALFKGKYTALRAVLVRVAHADGFAAGIGINLLPAGNDKAALEHILR